MRNYFLYFIVLFLILQSCGSNKLATENKQLKMRIADLEHRIYELTESPDQLGEDLIQDVNLLMTIPSRDNLELAQSMIATFRTTYPDNKNIHRLEKKGIEIERLLKTQSKGNSSVSGVAESTKSDGPSDLKVQFSVQVTERRSGFINVELSAQNLSHITLSNVWIKATLVDASGSSYGLTQDFFFNRLNPYEIESETLSWEYVQFDKIGGIVLKQMRYSKNRQTKMLKEHECIIGQGNVKIFLEF